MSFHDTFKPGDLLRYENRTGTTMPQVWVCPSGVRHRMNELPSKVKRETGILPEGVYLVVVVRDHSVDVIYEGKVVELLVPIDLYPVTTK